MHMHIGWDTFSWHRCTSDLVMGCDHAEVPRQMVHVMRFLCLARVFLREGAVHATGGSVVSFEGETVFTGNTADSYGGEPSCTK